MVQQGNKVIFTHIPYPEFKSAFYIKGFEKEQGVKVLIYFKKQFFIRRYLDDFDYISFLNKEIIKGESFVILADEEKEALDMAMNSKNYME